VFVAAITSLRVAHTDIFAVVEFGCGTGWVPQGLPELVEYLGVDANAECITRARARNPGRHRQFVVGDLRAFTTAARVATYDSTLVCAFSVLKHFGLKEWDDVVAAVLRHGMRGLFSVPVGPETKDDGTEFPHVWVTRERLQEAVEGAGHVIVQTALLPWGETMVESVRDDW
jgi:SAM-dependent methyltransferase